MQMQLKQAHIEAAIRDFVTKAGIQFPVDEISFTAGRGKDGLTATIELEDPFAALLDKASGSEPEVPAPKATRTMEARGNENIMPAVKTDAPVDKKATTPDQDFVDEEDEAPITDSTPVTDKADSPKTNGASLFGG